MTTGESCEFSDPFWGSSCTAPASYALAWVSKKGSAAHTNLEGPSQETINAFWATLWPYQKTSNCYIPKQIENSAIFWINNKTIQLLYPNYINYCIFLLYPERWTVETSRYWIQGNISRKVVPGSVSDLKRRSPHVTQPNGAPIGHAGAEPEHGTQVLDQHVCHEIWSGLSDLLSSTCESSCLTTYHSWDSVNLKSQFNRKLSNLLSGQWTSLQLRISCIFSPSFEAKSPMVQATWTQRNAYRRLTKKPMPCIWNTWAATGLPSRPIKVRMASEFLELGYIPKFYCNCSGERKDFKSMACTFEVYHMVARIFR